MLTPHKFQEENIELAKYNNVLIADECGLGKTLSAIESVRQLPPGPTLVVGTKSTKEQWREAIIQQMPSASVYVLGTAGSLPEDFNWKMIQPGTALWVITHYASLLTIGETIANLHWSTVIADEAQHIKNRRAKRTLILKRIKADRRIALSGTPMEKHVDDMWSIFNWLDRKEWSSYWAFRKNFLIVERHPYMNFLQVIGPKNLDKLREKTSSSFIRHTKQQVAPELPPLVQQRIPLLMDKAQQNLYNELATSKDIEAQVGGEYIQIKNALARLVKLQQLSSAPHLLGYRVKSSKEEFLLEFIADHPEPVIVFTLFRESALRLGALLKGAILIGGLKNPSIPVAQFMSGKKDTLVATIATGGEGLNLQRATRSIFVDQHWSSMKMQQAVDRIHRLDITESKHVIYLYNKGTVDELVLQALDNKWSEQELVYHFLGS
jgi:SNF2 family DNA or RNA helicase